MELNNQELKLTEQEAIRLEKMQSLQEMGISPFGDKFVPKNRSEALKKELSGYSREELGEKKIPVSVAGRIMTKRGKGKAGFAHIQDGEGQIQIYVRKDLLTELEFEVFNRADIGDIVGVTGEAFMTEAGELSVKAHTLCHITKALKPLPEKYHGITNDDLRLRHRYLDIIMNSEVKELFIKKQLFWGTIRAFLLERGFLEVETPVLEVISGGAAATPFKTHHNALDIDVFLRISMGELWQKKLLVAGYEKTFEIGRQFRNEGMSNEHLQDYTQMEFYWAYADCRDGMEVVAEMYRRVTQAVHGSLKFTSKGFEIDLGKDWEIYDFETVIKENTGIGIYDASLEEIQARLSELKISYDKKMGFWRLVDILWKTVRKDLVGPGFLIGQPVQLNPLPKRRKDDPRKVDQMQVIIAGSEMGNGYSELNDPLDLEQRFIEQRKMSDDGDEEAHNHDADFIEALKYGMPPAFGFGVSERLFSVMMDKPIRECVMFPLMKPER